MFKADVFRVKAAKYAESIKYAESPKEVSDLNQRKQSFIRLAENEEWLALNFDKIIHSQDIVPQFEVNEMAVDSRTTAEIEEHILRCLGAAVVMQWNAIPTRLRRELFDSAGSLGDVLETTALRGHIARFLHRQNEDKSPANEVSERIFAKG